MNNIYKTTIPGNYLKSWLNSFEEQVKNHLAKKIAYGTWKELKRLSELNRINFRCRFNENGVILGYDFDLLHLFCDDNDFAHYLEKCMLGIIPGEKIFPQLTWESESNTSKSDLSFIDSTHKINDIKIDANLIDKDTILINSDSITAITGIPITYSTDITSSGSDTYTTQIEEITKSLAKLNIAVFDADGNLTFNKNTDKKDNNIMNTNDMFNFDFGPVSDSKIRMSMYGYAIPNEAGKYVSYDVKGERMMDVQILNFDCAGMFYKIPKALADIACGDVVFHNGVPVFITDIYEDRTRFVVIDPKDGTEKTILPAHSPFGFDYLTTLVSLMDGFDAPASNDNPFGHMLPFILMSNSKNSNQTLPLLFMMNGKMDMNNPLMLMALSGNNSFDTNNPLMLMAMMKSFGSK